MSRSSRVVRRLSSAMVGPLTTVVCGALSAAMLMSGCSVRLCRRASADNETEAMPPLPAKCRAMIWLRRVTMRAASSRVRMPAA